MNCRMMPKGHLALEITPVKDKRIWFNLSGVIYLLTEQQYSYLKIKLLQYLQI